LVEDYLADCRARGLSPKTIKLAYGYPLQHVLLPWCKARDITEPAQLDNRVLNRLTSELLETGGRRGKLSREEIELEDSARNERDKVIVRLPAIPQPG
jgi:hypothetical protein